MHFAPVPSPPSPRVQQPLRPTAQQCTQPLWTAPDYDPVSGLPHPRRLDEVDMTGRPLPEILGAIEANRERLEEFKQVVKVPKAGNTEADIETLLGLMGTEDKPRAAWPLEC
eukprot:s2271_g6.t1